MKWTNDGEVFDFDLLILDLLFQSCEVIGEDDLIDNQCLSVYEAACNYLWKKGLLKKINHRLFRAGSGKNE